MRLERSFLRSLVCYHWQQISYSTATARIVPIRSPLSDCRLTALLALFAVQPSLFHSFVTVFSSRSRVSLPPPPKFQLLRTATRHFSLSSVHRYRPISLARALPTLFRRRTPGSWIPRLSSRGVSACSDLEQEPRVSDLLASSREIPTRVFVCGEIDYLPSCVHFVLFSRPSLEAFTSKILTILFIRCVRLSRYRG